mmetsp:Transcript_34803/g.78945  ORF Transcript_34803/g.78945 Transcript_34803/m.78945 type:complete len:224 (-) Transcript_34803:410-1081(-)
MHPPGGVAPLRLHRLVVAREGGCYAHQWALDALVRSEVEGGEEVEHAVTPEARVGGAAVAIGRRILLGCDDHVTPIHQAGSLKSTANLVDDHCLRLECAWPARHRAVAACTVVDEKGRDRHTEQRSDLHLVVREVVFQHEGRTLRRGSNPREEILAHTSLARREGKLVVGVQKGKRTLGEHSRNQFASIRPFRRIDFTKARQFGVGGDGIRLVRILPPSRRLH